jgi:broad specificity phosphatase PhoE
MFLLLERERTRVINERKPHRIILIRHGESAGNTNPQFYATTPDWQVPLTEQGRKQSQEAGRLLRTIVGNERVHFFVSPFVRAKQTFEEIVSELPPRSWTMIEEPRLREQEWGNLVDKPAQDAAQKIRSVVGKFFYRFPCGESGADCYDRVSVFLETLFRSFNKDMWNGAANYVLVSHGLLIRLFLMRYFHWTVQEFSLIENLRNCQMIILEKDPKTGKYWIAPPGLLYMDGEPVTLNVKSPHA